jgi:GT2 family glycosyltransferase
MGAVHALMLTFAAPANARTCAEAIGTQTVRPDHLLVIENPSGSAPLDRAELERAAGLPVELVVLAQNVGPAGGYAAGISELRDAEMLWVLDDDVLPRPDCLARQLAASAAHDDHALVFPSLVDAETGAPCSTWGWVGVLIPGAAVRAAGIPDPALFYGMEDQDYLIDRCGQVGYPLVRADDAVAELRRRADDARPDWHFYYLSRNLVYQHLYRRRHVRFDLRMKRLVANLREVWRLDGARCRPWKRAALMILGALHGALGMLGRRMDPGSGARPS